MVRGTFILAALPAVSATSPMDQVFKLMDECAAKAYKEYFEWCDDAAKNSQFEIKTAKAEKEDLEAKIGEFTSNIGSSNAKIEDLAASIAKDEKELEAATGIREKERKDFEASESELVADIDTLDRAIAILERELSKNPGAFAQISGSNEQMIVQALGAITDAAGFSGADKTR